MADTFFDSEPIVVVGGGFGGLTTALSLSCRTPRLPIILVEPRPRFVFLPLLYELLSGELQIWEVAPTYKSLLNHRGIVLIQDLVSNIDTVLKVVNTAAGLKFKYSQLVLATGSTLNDYSLPGVKKYALNFNTLSNVMTLRQKIKQPYIDTSEKQVYVIAGAGAAGIELACKLADLLDKRVEIHLIDASECVLQNGKSFNQEQAHLALQERGVKLSLLTRIISLKADSVELEKFSEDGSNRFSLPCTNLIWCAGIKSSFPNFLNENFSEGLRLPIDEYFQIIGLDDVFSLGDVAINELNPCPTTAQAAIQQGEALAQVLIDLRKGKAPKPFDFIDRGEILSLGVGNATITSMGLTIAGPLAFHMRRMVYLSKMPRLLMKARSVGAWLLDC